MTTASSQSVAVSAALVVFGATGDLAHRKLYPALASLAARGQLPRRLAIVGVSRTRMSDEDFATEVRNAIAKASDGEAEGRQNALDERGVQYRYIAGPFDDDDTFRRLGEVLNERDAEHGTAGNVLYYLATIPQMFANVAAGRWTRRAGGRVGRAVPPDRRREALRPRPAELARARRRAPPPLPRAPDLPHRPLPGEGDGPEHPRPSVHQHDLRADLESPVRRPRADHRGGGPRRRAPRDVLRAVGSVARHPPEPPPAGARADGDGTTRRRSMPTQSATRR